MIVQIRLQSPSDTYTMSISLGELWRILPEYSRGELKLEQAFSLLSDWRVTRTGDSYRFQVDQRSWCISHDTLHSSVYQWV